MKDIILTDSSKCRRCYSCVRNCPVKAVQIKHGKAQIIQQRCIQCGNCVRHCGRNAKIIMDSKLYVTHLLNSDTFTVAMLAPSFITSFYPKKLGEILCNLKNLGFNEIWETAIGAEYVMDHVYEYLKINEHKTVFSSACPAFVSLVEKHFPDLTGMLIPICSPMIATGRIIKKKYANAAIVFIGPCIAKKEEAQQKQFSNCIDAVLTFSELKDMISINNEDSDRQKPDFKYYIASKGRRIPIEGAINDYIKEFMYNKNLISVDGTGNCIELLKYVTQRNADADYSFYDTLMCKGCINGPEINTDLSIFEKTQILNKFISDMEKSEFTIDFYACEKPGIDMTRSFQPKSIKSDIPSEEDIQQILAQIGKTIPDDELNCGACGYETCREKAVAVFQGMAEVEMCFPYLIDKKNQLYNELSKRFRMIQDLNNELNAVFDSSYDGLIMCDATGKILRTNSAYRKMVCIDNFPETVFDLEKDNIVYPSASILVLKEKRRITFLQQIKSGKKLIATGNPIFDENGNLIGVVTNVRDIDELNRLRNNINGNNGKNKNDSYSGIVANSLEFGEVVDLAARAAGYKSTVILLGETGVGKDVIARFIHYMSEVKDGPFIKVNCGAIPENLMEAELFGYESGAFTGAKKEGKKGLFEMADKGTIFLNEIGDLPMPMQVKLLQVIQDKKINRIGGGKGISVDVRIISATNKDLKQMIKDRIFRDDLYYRLNVVPIYIPPLRERKDDIMPLAYHFLYEFNRQYNTDKDFSPDINDILMEYYWPGNVRELENIIERIIVTSKNSVITRDDLPQYMFDAEGGIVQPIVVNSLLPLQIAKDEVEKIILKRAYKLYGNTYKMAEVLGVNQSTIVRKINKLKE